MTRAKTANNPVFAGILRDERSRNKGPQQKQGHKSNFNIQVEEDGDRNPDGDDNPSPMSKENFAMGQCSFCNRQHQLTKCEKFQKQPYVERIRIVRRAKLCDNCLTVGHMAKGCMKGKACEICGCNRRHHNILHPSNQENPNQKTKDDAQIQTNGGSQRTEKREREDGNCNSINRGGGVRLCVVPVKVKGKDGNKVIETYAFLDSGSDVTLCDEELVRELEIDGMERNFSLTTQERQSSSRKGFEVQLVVEALDGADTLDLQRVWTVNQVNVSQRSIATAEDLEKWPHLSDVELHSIENKEVRVLIGSDVPEAFWVLEERRGKRREPYAVRSPLGWAVMGPTQTVEDEEDNFNVNFIRVGDTPAGDDALLQQVKCFWETDFGGSISDHKTAMSVQDKKALQILEASAELVDGHYQVGLPWKHNPPFQTIDRSR